ncbi:MAG: ATP synthase subunit I, partial [Candidatus Binataceae bacterium]
MNWSVPTIAGIQRVTALVALALSATLLILVSPAMALGCLIGGAVMLLNLYAWTLIAHSIMALANARQGSHPAGLILAPLKLVLLVVVVYLLISSFHINLAGFLLGLLTQFVAIFIETWRVSRR